MVSSQEVEDEKAKRCFRFYFSKLLTVEKITLSLNTIFVCVTINFGVWPVNDLNSLAFSEKTSQEGKEKWFLILGHLKRSMASKLSYKNLF